MSDIHSGLDFQLALKEVVEKIFEKGRLGEVARNVGYERQHMRVENRTAPEPTTAQSTPQARHKGLEKVDGLKYGGVALRDFEQEQDGSPQWTDANRLALTQRRKDHLTQGMESNRKYRAAYKNQK